MSTIRALLNALDVNIENRGDHAEYYTLYNLPQWLSLVGYAATPLQPAGDIAPQKTKTLRFQVNALVAVGNYDVTIGLQGNNEILEPLRITLKVRGQMPDWAVDPADYENCMSVVGQIYINAILLSNSESRLAAFIDGECRGAAAPKMQRGAAYVPLSVYGTAMQEVNGQPAELHKGRDISFRLWDATTGIVYPNVNITLPGAAATQTLALDPAQNVGTFSAPAIFTKSNLIEQPLPLNKGWNWLSLGVAPSDDKVADIFQKASPREARLKEQGTAVAYCNGTYWAGSLKRLHTNTMYKLLLSRLETSEELPTSLTVVGEQVKLAETPATLKTGWNWLPFMPTTAMTLGEALAGANPQDGDQVKSQTAFAYYSRFYGWEGNLEVLESGKGYLYKSNAPATKTFVYPTLATASSRAMTRSMSRTSGKQKTADAAPSVFSPVAPTDYPDNMTMVIQLNWHGTPVADAEIAAFIDGECRGAAVADSDGGRPLYYLLIAGEGSGQPMELRVAADGSVSALCSDLTYSSDGNIGTPWQPFVIDLDDTVGISDQLADWEKNQPAWFTVQGTYIGTTRPTAPGVYLYRNANSHQQGRGCKKVVVK